MMSKCFDHTTTFLDTQKEFGWIAISTHQELSSQPGFSPKRTAKKNMIGFEAYFPFGDDDGLCRFLVCFRSGLTVSGLAEIVGR